MYSETETAVRMDIVRWAVGKIFFEAASSDHDAKLGVDCHLLKSLPSLADENRMVSMVVGMYRSQPKLFKRHVEQYWAEYFGEI